MAQLDAASVDAIVTDPPYGLGFMGKTWDSPGAFVERRARRAADGFDGIGGNHHPTSQTDVARTRMAEALRSQAWHQAWATEAFRVAKPGAYLLAFGGTRTYHRMTCAIEDAGWIIRDCLVWAYASGFPKSRALLKPAWEPIVMARKPGPLRELAIDACRIDTDGEVLQGSTVRTDIRGGNYGNGHRPTTDVPAYEPNPSGRWPANLILTDPIFDGDTPGVVGGGETQGGDFRGPSARARNNGIGLGMETMRTGTSEAPDQYGDSGTYSRFFLIPKADRAEREPVLGGLPDAGRDLPLVGLGNKFCTLCGESWVAADGWPKCGHGRENTGRRQAVSPKARSNVHPTVKPLDLMRHLVRLVTPSGGTVLDPFLGSGTTALAAEMEGFGWVGIEREPEYVAIAEARLNGTQRGLGI